MRSTGRWIGWASDAALRLLFPVRCPVCDGIVKRKEGRICRKCLPKLTFLQEPWCLICGRTVAEGETICANCGGRQHVFTRGRALYEYGSAAPSLYRFKYQGRQEYAAAYGEQVAEQLGDFIRSVHPDCLIPIPLHKSRYRSRGYNQSERLALEIGRQLQIPVNTKLLQRVKRTAPLKVLSPAERQNNLKNAFKLSENDVKLRITILIDDIYTTGATLDEAARTLRAAGVEKIYFIALACGAGV